MHSTGEETRFSTMRKEQRTRDASHFIMSNVQCIVYRISSQCHVRNVTIQCSYDSAHIAQCVTTAVHASSAPLGGDRYN